MAMIITMAHSFSTLIHINYIRFKLLKCI